LYVEMLAHARAEMPNECCGLLAGRIEAGGGPSRTVDRRYPLVNEFASATEYSADPKSLIQAHVQCRHDALEFLAIYHSHPTSPPVPSRTDLSRNYWGSEVVHFIISLQGAEPVMRGWRLREDAFDEAKWELIEMSSSDP
jgi:proteasome lid subunit RPN8/RPN11